MSEEIVVNKVSIMNDVGDKVDLKKGKYKIKVTSAMGNSGIGNLYDWDDVTYATMMGRTGHATEADKKKFNPKKAFFSFFDEIRT
jgi:hypothetical protein